MLITLTGLHFISGAQMRLLQAKNGLFIDENTLVCEVDQGDDDLAAWFSTMPAGSVRRTSELEERLWNETQARRWAEFEERWGARRTGEPLITTVQRFVDNRADEIKKLRDWGTVLDAALGRRDRLVH